MWTEEQYQAWKARPETAEFLTFLRDVREDLKERWANGEKLDEDHRAIAIVYGDIIGLQYERDVKEAYVRMGVLKEESEDDHGDDGGRR